MVVIMAKQPLAGQVKTRLCPPLAPDEAARLYGLFIQAIVEDTTRLAREPGPGRAEVALAHTPAGAEAALRELVPAALPLFAQSEGDLGERLAAIFDGLLAKGHEQVLVIGSDCPDLPCELIHDAIARLADPAVDLVLGPSPDGGYYLVGLKRPAPALFAGMAWSTEKVLAATLERARGLGLAVAMIQPWQDIDTHADLIDLLARNRHRDPAGYCPGWRTLSCLRQSRWINP